MTSRAKRTRGGLYQPKTLELVEVEWRDSMFDGSFDGPTDDYAARVSHPVTCGYFVRRDPDGITVAMSQEAAYDQVRHLITIPIENVRAVWPVRTTRKRARKKGAA
jgi:hypothetical protein